jgi:hypothetical protein
VRELCPICVDIPYTQLHENKQSLTTFYSSNLYIQGADDKLGQFLDQDIVASANHILWKAAHLWFNLM